MKILEFQEQLIELIKESMTLIRQDIVTIRNDLSQYRSDVENVKRFLEILKEERERKSKLTLGLITALIGGIISLVVAGINYFKRSS